MVLYPFLQFKIFVNTGISPKSAFYNFFSSTKTEKLELDVSWKCKYHSVGVSNILTSVFLGPHFDVRPESPQLKEPGRSLPLGGGSHTASSRSWPVLLTLSDRGQCVPLLGLLKPEKTRCKQGSQHLRIQAPSMKTTIGTLLRTIQQWLFHTENGHRRSEYSLCWK